MDNLQYEVIEKKENPLESKIKKTGLTAEFTLGDIARDLAYLNKKKLELQSEVQVQAAIQTNIERDMPEIKSIPEENRQIIFIYTKAFSFVKVGLEKLEEIENQIKEYVLEQQEILKQTGLYAPDEPVRIKVQDKNAKV